RMSEKLRFPWSGRVRDEFVARGCEAELRGDAFPSGAWERGFSKSGAVQLMAPWRDPNECRSRHLGVESRGRGRDRAVGRIVDRPRLRQYPFARTHQLRLLRPDT